MYRLPNLHDASRIHKHGCLFGPTILLPWGPAYLLTWQTRLSICFNPKNWSHEIGAVMFEVRFNYLANLRLLLETSQPTLLIHARQGAKAHRHAVTRILLRGKFRDNMHVWSRKIDNGAIMILIKWTISSSESILPVRFGPQRLKPHAAIKFANEWRDVLCRIKILLKEPLYIFKVTH